MEQFPVEEIPISQEWNKKQIEREKKKDRCLSLDEILTGRFQVDVIFVFNKGEVNYQSPRSI